MTGTRTGDAPSTLRDRHGAELLRAILALQTPAAARRFFRDLLTEDEIGMITDRWRVARMLHAGESYREIEARTGVSSRTIARISRWLRQGEGGYRQMLEHRDHHG